MRNLIVLVSCIFLYHLGYTDSLESNRWNLTSANCSEYFQLLRSGNITRLDVPFSCEKYPLGLEIFLGIVLSIIVIGSIGGNFLVILAVCLVNRLRIPNNILIVNLAFSDLLVSLLVMPVTIHLQINRFRWTFSELFCDVYLSFDVLFCTSSILNLCSISIDRYLLLFLPLRYSQKRTNKFLLIYVSLTWILSFLISVLPVVCLKEPFIPGACEYSNNLGYQIFATLSAFFIPLIVMIALYIKIFILASQAAKKDQQRLPLSPPDLDDSSIQMDNVSSGKRNSEAHSLTKSKPQRKKLKSSSDGKPIRTLGVIMGCFVICWLPFFIIQFAKPIMRVNGNNPDDHLFPWLFELFLWLGYLNSFLNPIIYAKFNRDFRSPFIKILCFQCCSINKRLRDETYNQQLGRESNAGRLHHEVDGPRLSKYHSSSNPRINRRRSSDPFTYISKKNQSKNQSNCHDSLSVVPSPRERHASSN